MMVKIDSKIILFMAVALCVTKTPVAAGPKGGRSKMWNGAETALAAVPTLMSFYQGKTSLGSMT